MRKKLFFSFVLSVFVAVPCFSQQKSDKARFRYHSINNIGLLEGQAGSAFALQTINGIQYQSWFAGIGVGLDYYRYRTIPLFFEARKEFGRSANTFFIYADAGMNFYWKRDKDAKQFPVEDRFKNGFYAETGIGYKIKLNAKINLLLNAGYSLKKITEQGSYYVAWDPIGWPGGVVSSPDIIRYDLNRLILKIGFEF
ncbi:MAG: hypothetical protein JST47_13260 [Bacteroidetes bacterium]|nr:hypothetical protein [Bacteroidota bacterium]